MGVKGLWKRVLADYSQGLVDFTENVKRGSTLLVDGNGFLFHLLNEQVYNLYKDVEPKFEREYGGNYKELSQIIRLELDRLVKMLGFDCIFYFDGGDSFFKGDTTEKRRESIRKSWSNWYDVVIGDQNKVQSQQLKELPIPPLGKDELLWCLEQAHIKCVITEYEADQEMALECYRRNLKYIEMAEASGSKIVKRCYCYSGDSDFLVMKDCPLISFGGLDAYTQETLAQTKSIFYREIDVIVWKRENVAKLYSIPESEFVDLCIVAGNDFTGHFAKEHVHQNHGHDGGPTTALNLPMPIYSSTILMSKDFEMAVQYSKAFYELEDLTEFYLMDEYRTSQHVTSWKEMDPGAILLSTQSNALRSWIIHNSSRLLKEKEYSYQIIAMFFNEVVMAKKKNWTTPTTTPVKQQTPVTGKQKKKAIETVAEHGEEGEVRDEEDESMMFDIIQPFHLDALKEMHLYLMEHTEIVIAHNKDPTRASSTDDVPMKWENVCAGNLYQLMSRTLRKYFLTLFDENDTQLCIRWQPSSFFHGKLFHHILYKRGMNLNKRVLNTPTTTPATKAPLNNGIKDSPILPVDSHREIILQTIARDRVTIIHGETGCGKSSKIPLFILEDCEKKHQRCKIMIAQPRRIAVINLRNRLRDFLGDKIGMRMGHGVREESPNTKIFFVTTGYLVRLLAHAPMALQSITHLIIDEVHERSVDGDLLCWLTKRYLTSNLRMKVLLMSATLHTDLYQRYFTNAGGFFGSPAGGGNASAGLTLGALEDDENEEEGEVPSDGIPKCLSVGVRRFPAQIYHVEDLLQDKTSTYSNRTKAMCEKLVQECSRCASDLKDIPVSLVKAQYDLVLELIRIKSNLGTGILVFVSGLADIIELQTRFENLQSTRYRCVAIHSEIPFEEQESALQPAEPTEVKVIIATNAAESSITLPDVDMVICLGTHKAINYRQGDLMRSILINCWISKSSAIQRAGRTGRVRPGEVYRLYTQSIYEKFHEHQQAEIHRKPLHEVILTLKAIFQDSEDYFANNHCVSTVLQELLEPPDLSQLQFCFDFLFESGMINSPTDDSKLTSHGSFTGRMPIDLSLCKLIIYGVSIGLGAEAVILASALSQPKTLFRIASPLIHSNPDEYNEIVRKTFVGMMTFDNNVYSEPIMLLQMFIAWQQLAKETPERRYEFLQYYGIVAARMKHFVSVTHNLLKEVNKNKGQSTDDLTFDSDYLDRNLTSDTINKLRLILLWALEFNLLQSSRSSSSSIGHGGNNSESNNNVQEHALNTIAIPKASIPLEVISSYFPKPRFTHEAKEQGKYIYQLPAMPASAGSGPGSSMSLQGIPSILKNIFNETSLSFGVEQGMMVYRYDPRELPPSMMMMNSYGRGGGGRGRGNGRNGNQNLFLARVFIAVNKRILTQADAMESMMQQQQRQQQHGDLPAIPHNLLTLSTQAALASSSAAAAGGGSSGGGLEYVNSFNDSIHPEFVIFTYLIDREDYLVTLNNFMLQLEVGFSISYHSNKEIKFVAINFQPTSNLFRALYPSGALELDYMLAEKFSQAIKKPSKIFDMTQVLSFVENEDKDGEDELDGFGGDGPSTPQSHGQLGDSFEDSLGDSLRELRQGNSSSGGSSSSKKQNSLMTTPTKGKKEGDSSKEGIISGKSTVIVEERNEEIEQLVSLPMFLPLFEDLLPGKRLFNAYCLGHKDKKMRVFVKVPRKIITPRKVTSLVPGTLAWQQKKQQSPSKVPIIARPDEDELRQGGGGDNDNDVGEASNEDGDRIECLGVKPLVSGWSIHGSFLTQSTFDAAMFEEDEFDIMDVMYDTSSSEWTTAVFSTRSILSTSYYSPKLPVVSGSSGGGSLSRKEVALSIFGVSYYALTLGTKRKTVACEGVTLFPPDKTWILRGLLCIGRRLHADAENELDRLSNSQSAKLPMSVKCRNVRALITQLKNKSFQPDKTLIEALNDLFTDYVYF